MSRYAKSTNAFILSTLGWIVTLAFVMTPFASAQRTRLKPGMNFFTPQQDVELGLQVSKDAEKKLTMLNNQRVDDYLNRLGKRLAAVAPDGGIVSSGNSSALAYGATMAIFTPRTDNLSSVGLKEATNQLIEDLRSSNSGMRIAKD